jgi:hypothetical protein
MTMPARAEILAYRLACALPRWQDEGGVTQRPSERRRRGYFATRELADAVEMELTELVALPGLERLIALGRSVTGRRALATRLVAELDGDAARYRRELLWQFVTGEGAYPDADDADRPRVRTYSRQVRRKINDYYRQLRRKISDGWLARKTAVVWMNILIACPLVFVYVVYQGDSDSVVAKSSSGALALKAFAVWSLAFLPGWLYVRFLGQRAGALWNEYVQNLHRLGIDQPQFLPRPPENSEYFGEWLEAEGYRHTSTTNLYRQKFSAYYGSTVTANTELRSNFTVTTETMFPVFMSTLMLATGFTTLMLDTSFAEAPVTVWDMVKFGFLGAYVFIAQSLIRRFFQSDLRPSAYAAAIQRVVVVLITVVAVHQLLRPTHQANVEAVVAFVVGIFPVVAFQALYRVAASALRAALPQLTPSYPLNQLDGLNIWYENRLVEEGIEDMENLATANMVDVILHTRVPVGRLVDWIDQAHLYLHLDRVERGRGERRQAQKTAEGLVNAAVSSRGSNGSHAIPSQTEKLTSGNRDPQTNEEAKQRQPDLQDGQGDVTQGPEKGRVLVEPSRTHGSVRPGDRAGTRSRIALRQLGVRNATDLLKAFPPDQIDPRQEEPSVARCFAHLSAAGVDMDQIRTLARVLDEDTGLAPIWNWQTRGSVARAPSRRPRSLDAHGAVSTRATGQPQGDGKSSGATPRQRRSATGPSSDKTITDLTRPSASPAER